MNVVVICQMRVQDICRRHSSSHQWNGQIQGITIEENRNLEIKPPCHPFCIAEGSAVGELLFQILCVETLASLVEEARGDLDPLVLFRPTMQLVE